MSLSRAEIIAAIQECARKLGRPPTLAELKKMAGIPTSRLKYFFHGSTAALREAGLDPRGRGHLIPNSDLLLDWARVARKMGKLPPMNRYESVGRSTHVPFIRRYGSCGDQSDSAFNRIHETTTRSSSSFTS